MKMHTHHITSTATHEMTHCDEWSPGPVWKRQTSTVTTYGAEAITANTVRRRNTVKPKNATAMVPMVPTTGSFTTQNASTQAVRPAAVFASIVAYCAR